ncbi:MAG TPA: aspartate aminotransferase family protein [Thermodesulfobacteriota bacterium]|nr:aspartate aminotransferase family protein [Thermodesulfobacteriota bacterium]
MVEEKYIKQRPKSKALYREAVNIFPSGITHDTRFLLPFPTYIKGAKGSRKWDVDGNEYVDFAMGHGALLLGHGREEVIRAVESLASQGTHYGGSSEIEIKWGEMVKELIPSVERVRFTTSGTEATLLALRLARAYTGKTKVIKFQGHFHGWHDYVAVGERPPWEINPPGVPEQVIKTVIAVPSDLTILEELLVRDNDVAGVILEPTGGSWGKVPTPDGFLKKLRHITGRFGVLLIFDEVVTGFRWSKGGAQGLYGVMPDLTTLAKILAGGFPGGAVAGKREVMEMLEFSGDDERDKRKKIRHQGTFNANPVSAAAGVACLQIVSTGSPQEAAAGRAGEIRKAMNEVIQAHSVSGCVYGDSSVFHIILGVTPQSFAGNDVRNPSIPPEVLKMGGDKNLTRLLQLSMLVEGVDLFHLGGLVSSAHTDDDLEKTVKAFEATVSRLKKGGML